ncbi:hypothetical protein BH23GEM11_BH23GEM11_16630 [soil metagenome]
MGESERSGADGTWELLDEIQGLEGDEKLGIGEITEVIGGRAHGLILLVLSIPETIPMVGLSAILAAPIFVIGVVLVVKGANPGVPGWVQNRSLPRDKVQGAIRRLRRVVQWLDRVLRPRWSALAKAGRFQGLICVVMAILLAIPIPGINMVAAAAVAGVGLGILQRDGVVIAVAAVLAVVATVGFGFAISGASSLVMGWFGS